MSGKRAGKNLILQGEPGNASIPGSHDASSKKPASEEAGFHQFN